MMLDEIVSITPHANTATMLPAWLNSNPNTAIDPAAHTITHFRSTRSANVAATSGPNGAASAMMKV